MSARTACLTAVAAWLLLLLVWGPWAAGQEGAAPGPLGGDEAAAPGRPPRRRARWANRGRCCTTSRTNRAGWCPCPASPSTSSSSSISSARSWPSPTGSRGTCFSRFRSTGRPAAGAEYAELAVRLKVLAREEGWIRVPLGFDRSFLVEPADHEGPGEGLVQYEGASQGYIGWIRGAAGEEHEFRLNLLTPLADVGDETRLRLLAPGRPFRN